MTRLEEAQQELDAFKAKMTSVQQYQVELKATESALKKKIKATEEEIEQLTPVEPKAAAE